MAPDACSAAAWAVAAPAASSRRWPSALPGLHGVGEQREQPAQFDRSRQLAALLEGGADGGSLSFGDGENMPGSMDACQDRTPPKSAGALTPL